MHWRTVRSRPVIGACLLVEGLLKKLLKSDTTRAIGLLVLLLLGVAGTWLFDPCW